MFRLPHSHIGPVDGFLFVTFIAAIVFGIAYLLSRKTETR